LGQSSHLNEAETEGGERIPLDGLSSPMPDRVGPRPSSSPRKILDLSPLNDLKTVQVLGELIQKAHVGAG
jgi:hypothetical protein